MEIKELDRLVSKTELTPATKQILRRVRKSVMSGRVNGPAQSKYKWTVEVNDIAGVGAKFSFRFRRENDKEIE